ncbi:MAG: ribonuclease D [Parvibaculales bacterium]
MQLITDNDSLTEACQTFTEHRYITVDTEFLRERTFWPKLCLIQVACPGHEALIDPLAEGLDLTPFYKLLKNSKITKVMHGCRQDIEIFFKETGQIPAPLMDTQVMAMVCGFGDAAGYETLVRRVANEKIDKGSRFTDWAQRPLSDKQLTYALADVTHLRVIFEKLEAQLTENKRLHWVREEMKTLTDKDTYRQLPENAWRRLRMNDKRPHVIGVLMHAAAWREQKAQSQNIPRQRVLKDDTLREIALQGPQSLEALEKLRSFPKGLSRSSQINGLLDAIKRGRKTKKQDLPDLPEQIDNKPGIGPLVDLLKVLLKYKCEKYDVAPKLIANVADLERIASDDDPQVKALKGWRKEIFGNDALKLKNGKIGLACSNGEVTVIDCT